MAIGAPILGDVKYARPDQNNAFAATVEGLSGELHLHARALRLPHPAGGTLLVEADLPPHMTATFRTLGFHAPAGTPAAAALAEGKGRDGTAETLPRLVRIGLWSLAVLVVLVVAGGAVVALSFDPDSLKPRIVAAVKQATGRDLTLNGRIRLGLSLRPTLVVQDVAFANPPGFSRPQMATLERLDLKLALMPLLSHRVEIDRLVLVKPDILLETDAQGRPNWQFTPEPGPPAPHHRRTPARQTGRRPAQRRRRADRERHA